MTSITKIVQLPVTFEAQGGSRYTVQFTSDNAIPLIAVRAVFNNDSCYVVSNVDGSNADLNPTVVGRSPTDGTYSVLCIDAVARNILMYPLVSGANNAGISGAASGTFSSVSSQGAINVFFSSAAQSTPTIVQLNSLDSIVIGTTVIPCASVSQATVTNASGRPSNIAYVVKSGVNLPETEPPMAFLVVDPSALQCLNVVRLNETLATFITDRLTSAWSQVTSPDAIATIARNIATEVVQQKIVFADYDVEYQEEALLLVNNYVLQQVYDSLTASPSKSAITVPEMFLKTTTQPVSKFEAFLQSKDADAKQSVVAIQSQLQTSASSAGSNSTVMNNVVSSSYKYREENDMLRELISSFSGISNRSRVASIISIVMIAAVAILNIVACFFLPPGLARKFAVCLLVAYIGGFVAVVVMMTASKKKV